MCSVKRIRKELFHWAQGFSSPSWSWQKMTLMIITSISQWTLFWVFSVSRLIPDVLWVSTPWKKEVNHRISHKDPWSPIPEEGGDLALFFVVWGLVWIFQQFGFHRVHSLTLLLQHLLTSEPWMSLFPHGFVLFRRTQTFGKAGQDLLGKEGKA